MRIQPIFPLWFLQRAILLNKVPLVPEDLYCLLDFDGFEVMLTQVSQFLAFLPLLILFLFLSCSIWFLFRPAQKPENRSSRWSNNSSLWLLLIYNWGVYIFPVRTIAEPVLISILRGLTHLKAFTQRFANLCVTAFTLLCSFRFSSDLEF